MSCIEKKTNDILNILKTETTQQISKLLNILDINLETNTIDYFYKFNKELHLILNELVMLYKNNCFKEGGDKLFVYVLLYYNNELLLEELRLERKIEVVDVMYNSVMIKCHISNIYPYLYNISKQLTTIEEVSYDMTLQKRKEVLALDKLSHYNESRRILYGWNSDTGDQLHKYLDPDFDEYTKDINEFIRERQKKYTVAIVDDGLINNDTDYQVIQKKNSSNCNKIDDNGNIDNIITYYEDFVNVVDNYDLDEEEDKRTITNKILFNNFWEDMDTCYYSAPNYIRNMDEYGSHGTPVISACAGYKYGIAPNVNVISYCLQPYSNSTIDKAITDIIELNNDATNEIEIIAINQSSGPPNILQNRLNQNDIQEMRDSIYKNTILNEHQSRISDWYQQLVYVVASGNDNDNVKNHKWFESDKNLNENKEEISEKGNEIIGFNERIPSSGSDNKSFYGIMSGNDNHKSYHVSVGSFSWDKKEITPYTQIGHPYYYYQKPDVIAPGNIYVQLRDGKNKLKKGTSFSAPLIAGLSVLVRCLVDYFIENHNAPIYLKTPEMISNLIKESSIMLSNKDNIFYTKTDQGYGLPTLFNIYKYLRSQNKNLFTSPLYKNRFIKSNKMYIESDTKCDENLDQNECLEYAYNFKINKESNDYGYIKNYIQNNFVSDQDDLCDNNDYCSKKSYTFTKDTNSGVCILNKSQNKVFYKKSKGSGEKYICKKNKPNINTDYPPCYKRIRKIYSGITRYEDVLVDNNNQAILNEGSNRDDRNFKYCNSEEVASEGFTTNTNTIMCKTLDCKGKCVENSQYEVDNYGICVKKEEVIDINKRKELIFSSNKKLLIIILIIIISIIFVVIIL